MSMHSWQALTTSKVLRVFFTIVLVAFWTACADDSQNLKGPDADAASKGKSTYNFGDYNVSLAVSADGKTWTYTITKSDPSKKNLSHFIINLQNCGLSSANFNDINSASVNGVPAQFVNTEGRTGCDPQSVTTNFVKIVDLPAAGSYVIVLTFDVGYQIAATTGWIKAGTTCLSYSMPGPGCPLTAYCTLSQGYYFANGSDANGSSAAWGTGVDIFGNGNVYTLTEGNTLWNFNTGQNGRDEIRAFFQYSAIILSLDQLGGTIPSGIAADMLTIYNYYYGKAKLTPTNATNTSIFPEDADVGAAGGRIGTWINANECL